MFMRHANYLRALQRLQILPIRGSTNIPLTRNYATLRQNFTPVLSALQTKAIYSNKLSVRYGSQQLVPQEQSEGHTKHGIEDQLAKLESVYRLNGFIGVDHLRPVMGMLRENPNLKFSSEQSLFLLNLSSCQMPSLKAVERLSNFQNIFQYLEQSNQITKDHYRSMLEALQYNRAPLRDFRFFLEQYQKHNGTPSEIMSLLLTVAGANGNVEQATEILAEMRNLQLALTEQDFNSLVLAYARSHDLNGMKTVMDSMHATGITSSTQTESTLIVAHIENGDETKASSILQQFHGQFQPHEIIKILQSIAGCSLISANFVSQLIKELEPDYVVGSEVPKSLRRICVELLHNDQLEKALCIIDTLPKPNFQENQDIDTYGVFLLYALFGANCEIEKIIEIAIHLEDTEKNTRALTIAAEIALKRNPPKAVAVLQTLMERNQPLRPHYFWPLMMYNFRRHSEAGILRTLKIMQDFKVECDHQTIVEYVIPRLSTIVTNPRMALTQLDDVGIKTSRVMTPIIAHMLIQNKWFDIISVAEAYTTKIDTSYLMNPLCNVAVHVRATRKYYHFAKMLRILSNKNNDQKQDFIGQFLIQLLSTQTRMRYDLHSCKRLLGELHKNGLNLSPAAANRIQTILKPKTEDSNEIEIWHNINQMLNEMTKHQLHLANTDEGDSILKHPRDMTYDELECHLVELETKEMNARGVLRRLLQVCVRDNRLERAVEIKNKCDKLKVQTSPGMMASIFDLYTKLGDLANAQKYFQDLQRTYPGFHLDEHKFVDYAALLVKCGQLENAKNLLEERSFYHKIVGGDYVLKNVWNLLTNVAYLAAKSKELPEDRNLTRETYAFLQKLGYCKTHNTILGPIVRERLLRGDFPGAIEEFKQLAEQYKCTPLQFELFSLVVRLCNDKNEEFSKKYNCTAEQAQKLLADLTEIVTDIHGVINMNSGLLLAFAESGSDNQLRRLLLTPEFRINEELLLRNCEHLGQEGSVQTLLRLARGCRGLNRVVNEQNIYNMLLNNFIKVNNYEAAIDLFERLDADDELKISQEFLRNLVQLLRTNNQKIPANIALRAHIVEDD